MRGRMPSTSRTLTLRCTLLQAALGAGTAGLHEATTARAEALGAQLRTLHEGGAESATEMAVTAVQTCVDEEQEGLSKAEAALSAELLLLYIVHLPHDEARHDVRPLRL